MRRYCCHIKDPLQAYKLISKGIINTDSILSDQCHRQLWIKDVATNPNINDIVMTAYDVHIDDRGYPVRGKLHSYFVDDMVGMFVWIYTEVD